MCKYSLIWWIRIVADAGKCLHIHLEYTCCGPGPRLGVPNVHVASMQSYQPYAPLNLLIGTAYTKKR
jgi:hypothetical protein